MMICKVLLVLLAAALVMSYNLDPRLKLTARIIRLRVRSIIDSYFSMQCYRELNL